MLSTLYAYFVEWLMNGLFKNERFINGEKEGYD